MNKWMVLLIGLFLCVGVSAQTTRSFYNRQGVEIKNEKRAAFYRDVEPRQDDLFTAKYFTKEGVLVWQSLMKSVSPDVSLNKTLFFPDGKIQRVEDYSPSGVTSEFYQSGQLKTQYSLGQNGGLNGEVVCFYENGQPLRRDIYKNGELVSGQCFSESGQEVQYYPFFTDASYSGRTYGVQGFMTEWVYRNLEYPRIALNNMTQGVVLVGFTVKANGVVTDVRLLRGVHVYIDGAAVKVVSESPAWKSPAKLNNEPIDAHYIAPVAFVIE